MDNSLGPTPRSRYDVPPGNHAKTIRKSRAKKNLFPEASGGPVKDTRPKPKRRLTERRKQLILEFLRQVSKSPGKYGQFGTVQWVNHLIGSLNERIKAQKSNPADIHFWLNNTAEFLPLLNQIPGWKNSAWLRASPRANLDSSPEIQAPTVSPLTEPRNRGNMQLLIQPPKIGGPSLQRLQEIASVVTTARMGSQLIRPPDSYTGSNPFILVSGPEEPEVINLSRSSVRSTIPPQPRVEPAIDLSTPPQVFHIMPYGGFPIPRHVPRPQIPNGGAPGNMSMLTFPKPDQLMTNYTNAMVNMVNDMKAMGFPPTPDGRHWEICYHALCILNLTKNNNNPANP